MKEETGKKIFLSEGENIIWSGKPKKSAFIATKSSIMLPIAIPWLVLDLSIIITVFIEGAEMAWIMIPFMIIHMTPVWIWLINVITANRRWKNTNYFITNRRVILQDGFFAVNEASLFYKDLHNAQMKIGLFDKIFHTGDILFDSSQKDAGFAFEDLTDYDEIYLMVQKIIIDIQTDMEYPNAFRPEYNPGYKTNYHP